MGTRYTQNEAVRDRNGKVFSHLIQFRTDFIAPGDPLRWLFGTSVLENLTESPDRRYAKQVE
jgi:hypothetical protein